MSQISTLGERIRTYRKQAKLTLEALAGDELTKGMLSLIENNKANPSMESLTYIAQRLGVEVTALLEEVSSNELRNVLEVAEKLYSVEPDQETDEYKQLLELVEPYIPKLTENYESARLLEMFSRSLYREKRDGWQEKLERAASIYDKLNLSSRLGNIGNFRAMVKFVEHEYQEALAILKIEREKIEERFPYLEPMTRLDFDYYEAILHFAVGDYEAAIQVINESIVYSKKHRILYRIDDIYRLAAAHSMMEGDVDRTEYYIKKIEQFGEFTEDEDACFFAEFIKIHILNSFKYAYEEALQQIKQWEAKYKKEYYLPFICLEKGKALCGLGNYEDALEQLNAVTIAEYIHHPYDLSIFYIKDSYKALCHLELGAFDSAIEDAKLAVKHFENLPNTPYKEFARQTYKKVLQ